MSTKTGAWVRSKFKASATNAAKKKNLALKPKNFWKIYVKRGEKAAKVFAKIAEKIV